MPQFTLVFYFTSSMSILAPVAIIFVIVALMGRGNAQTKTSLPRAGYLGVSSDSVDSSLDAEDEAPNPGDYYATAASSTGQYVIAGSYDGTFVSSDYGEHFTIAVNRLEMDSVAVSGSGQYMDSVAVSGSGQYMVSISASTAAISCLSYSEDYGASFKSDLGPKTEALTCAGIGIHSSGTYVGISVYPEGLWISNNVLDQSSWRLTYKTDVEISAFAFGGTSCYACSNNPPFLFHSNDYGYNWIMKGRIPLDQIESMAVDSSGVNVLIASSVGLYLSQDSGTSYERIYSVHDGAECAMSTGTSFIVHPSSGNYPAELDVHKGKSRKKPFFFLFSSSLDFSLFSLEHKSTPTPSPSYVLRRYSISSAIMIAIVFGSFVLCFYLLADQLAS